MMNTLYPNAGKEWSGMEITDLQHCISIGMLDVEIAQFLRRTVDEVRDKAAGLFGHPLRQR